MTTTLAEVCCPVGVGNVGGVFHSHRARLLTCLGELAGCSVVEAAVRSNFVVLLSPVGYLGARIEEIAEPTGSKALLPKLAVEALDNPILHGPSWLDVTQLNLPLQTPGKEVTAGQFRSVVAADGLRSAASRDQFIQNSCHSSAGEAGVHLQRQALTRKSIYDTQNTDRASGSDHIMSKIQRPLLVGCGQQTCWSGITEGFRMFLSHNAVSMAHWRSLLCSARTQRTYG